MHPKTVSVRLPRLIDTPEVVARIPASAAAELEAIYALLPAYIDVGNGERTTAHTPEAERLYNEFHKHLDRYESFMREHRLGGLSGVRLERAVVHQFLEGAVFVDDASDGAPLRIRLADGQIIEAPTERQALYQIDHTTRQAGLPSPSHDQMEFWDGMKRTPDLHAAWLRSQAARDAREQYQALCIRIAEDLAPTTKWAPEYTAARVALQAAEDARAA
ncbi:hypothetical protein ACX9R5_13300 [Rathayibacter sp. CAU 1779]